LAGPGRRVDARTDIIREGDRPDDVRLVLEGFACRYKILPDGKRHIMAYLVPGDLCDMHVFILKEMDHSIGTLSACRVVEIPRPRILEMLERPAIAQALWWAALVDEAALREWLVNIGRRPAEQRVGHLLCELLMRLQMVGLTNGNSYELPIIQSDVAETLGLSVVHVNCSLRRTVQPIQSAEGLPGGRHGAPLLFPSTIAAASIPAGRIWGMAMRGLEEKSFLLLLIAVTVAFVWILWPFSGAILWGTVLAIMFRPMNRRILYTIGQRPNVAALISLAVILFIVVLPVVGLGAALVREAVAMYKQIEVGEFDVGLFFSRIPETLPGWAVGLLNYFDLTDFADIQERISAVLTQGGQVIAAQALAIGQNTVQLVVSFFVMLYLLFFLLRDGDALARRSRDAVPLDTGEQNALFRRFALVIRAIVKGSIVVALAQGALGGPIFWLLGIQGSLLWGAVMAVLALVPVVGAGLIWVPASLYLLVTGSIWQGIVLIVFGALVISMVDNVLRPILVGGETKIPDYLVLIATLGGIIIFGFNGLLIGPVIASMFLAVWDLFLEHRLAIEK
jgi:predicted PurR-regulated permease PerM/CRP-like cAMP-binding protein